MYQSDILPVSITVLVQVYQRLSLVFYNDLYRRFTYIHHTSLLALTQYYRYQEGTRLTTRSPRDYSRFVTLSGSLLYSDP